jgi:hypothetical protein
MKINLHARHWFILILIFFKILIYYIINRFDLIYKSIFINLVIYLHTIYSFFYFLFFLVIYLCGIYYFIYLFIPLVI